MLRGEDILCGTSSTGTGALTLAAQPAPPGGVDFYHWLTAAGLNFVNGNAVLVSYTIIEYTTSGFTTQSQMEKGVGTLTLGASLAASTLARTTVQVTATGLNGTAAYNVSAPSAINIGTAANTLVFVGAAAADTLSASPYFSTSLVAAANCGVPGFQSLGASTYNLANDGTGKDWYVVIIITKPMLIKRVSVRVATAYTGGTPVSSAFYRLYAPGSNGQPGKLLLDFGALGGANPLNATGVIQSALHASGIFVTPGEYYGDLFATFTGGTGGPSVQGDAGAMSLGTMGTGGSAGTTLAPLMIALATGGSSTAGDPANVTGWARGSGQNPPIAMFSPT